MEDSSSVKELRWDAEQLSQKAKARSVRRKWLRDFALVLTAIGLTLAVVALLA